MAPAILQITSVGDLMGQQMLNRWHFVDPSGSADPTVVPPAFADAVLDPYVVMASSALRFTELIWRVITDPLSPQQSYALPVPLVGHQANPPAPSFVAATVRFGPGVTVVLAAEVPQRRVRRGGKRLGGMIDSYTINNQITSGGRPDFEAIIEGYLGMSDGGWVPCIAGFEILPVPRPHPLPSHFTVPNKYAPITSYILNVNLGSQVSRKVGHGA